uniref:Uncharacterized protein n=1 Tax=Arundo donax TaxID=35708 RepID=A0A0A9AVR1_ARUDO
MLVTQFAR